MVVEPGYDVRVFSSDGRILDNRMLRSDGYIEAFCEYIKIVDADNDVTVNNILNRDVGEVSLGDHGCWCFASVACDAHDLYFLLSEDGSEPTLWNLLHPKTKPLGAVLVAVSGDEKVSIPGIDSISGANNDMLPVENLVSEEQVGMLSQDLKNFQKHMNNHTYRLGNKTSCLNKDVWASNWWNQVLPEVDWVISKLEGLCDILSDPKGYEINYTGKEKDE